ncbi:ferredoxin [bacterium (Candidatus Gribaldobacteria) CG08_land_8_20_14_0_20_39_15]|uniref:Ferredoxin n=1 Tax=bacterium (Candidatus Gribaldobacteria) CG08_land_8_20_14_0_20_39_15 TaxID=2014273 RepID=A0A2M6XUB7_9BACT|nr:MAG: ferredoxin [bacterium (Candidatus Gribaldobacteria) CG08_land_8_20_14_0_20_39_15]
MLIKIVQSKCIGCGTCSALCSAYFELAGDGKAILKQSTAPQKDQLEVSEIGCAKEAADCCPTQCIVIK